MIEYVILILLTGLCACYNNRFTPRTRRWCLTILCVYVVLLFGVRYRVGIDTMNYMNSYDLTPNYNEFKQIDWSTNLREPGYLIVSMICRSITKDFWLLQIVMAAITNVGIFIFIHRVCINAFIGLLLYYFMACGYFTTDILRESAAIGIFLYNYRNITLKRWVRYYILCLVSISFHYSALITLCFPLFRHLRSTWGYWLVFIGLTISAPFMENMNDMITLAALVSRTSGYINQGGEVNLNFRIANLIHLVIPTIIAILILIKKKVKYEYLNMIWLQLLFCAGIFSIPIIFQRLTNYTMLFVVCALAQLFSSSRIRLNLKLITVALICLSYSFYYYTSLYRWYPYVSVFNKQSVPEREAIWWHDFGNK